jgi:hypothetical protein
MSRNYLVKPFLLVVTLVFASVASAQEIGLPYRLNDKDVEKIIKRIEQQSDRFRSSLDSALDKSRFNGTSREDDINAFVKDFYQSTKHLRDQFNHHRSTAPDVQSVLDKAARINSFMRRYPLSPRAQDDWSALKTNLDELASAYNVNWIWDGYQSAATNYPIGSVVSDLPYRVSDREVEQALRRIEQQSDKFRSALDSALDKSRLDGTREEDNINAFVKSFYESTKKLRDHFNNHKSTSADVQTVLDGASRIDGFMRRNRLRRNVESEWSRLRANLDELARIYNVSWRWGY